MARWPFRLVAGLFLAAGILHLGWETWELNFNPRLFADQRNPYVYAHASSDVLNLAAQMERLANVSPEGHDMVIHIVTPENYWPIPWYLRRFRRIGYWQDPEIWQKNTVDYPPPSVILLTSDVQAYVDARLPAAYNKQAIYGLRPGVPISMYVREDLWQAFVGQVAGYPSITSASTLSSASHCSSGAGLENLRTVAAKRSRISDPPAITSRL
jgi:hypothetical protein